MVQRGCDAFKPLVVNAHFDGKRALAGRRKHLPNAEPCRNPVPEPEPVQSRAGQNNRIVSLLLEFSQAGLDIAANIQNFQVGAQSQDLGLPAYAAGADTRARRELKKAPGATRNQGVLYLLALWNRGDPEAVGDSGGQVLHAVNGKVDLFVQQRLFDFFDENTHSRTRAYGRGRVPVGRRPDHLNLDFGTGETSDNFLSNPVRLRQSQCAAPAAYDQHISSHFQFPGLRSRSGPQPVPPLPVHTAPQRAAAGTAGNRAPGYSGHPCAENGKP